MRTDEEPRLHVGLPLLILMCALWSFTGYGAEQTSTTPTSQDSVALEEIRRHMKAGSFSDAEAGARRLLEDLEDRHGATSLQVAAALDLLVETLYRSGREAAPETIELARRALGIKEQHSPPRHPDLAGSATNLAYVLHHSGYFAEAASYYRRALEIQEQLKGNEHASLLWYLRILGDISLELGDYPSAKSSYMRSLGINRAIHGDLHAVVAENMYDLAIVLRRMGDYEGARPLYYEALEIMRGLHGKEYLKLAFFLNGLAGFLYETGDYAGARLQYEGALKIHENSSGSHPLELAGILNNLGLLLQKTGDYSEAKEQFEEALKIRRENLALDDAAVGQSFHNLAVILSLLGDDTGSRRAFEHALDIRERAHGRSHPNVATTLQYMADLLSASSEPARAEEYYRRAMEIYEATLQSQHVDLSLCLNGLAALMEKDNRLLQARELRERALEIQRRALGDRHPRVATTLSSLATVLLRTGNSEGALEAALQADQISREHVLLTTRTLPERQALRYSKTGTFGLDLALGLAMRNPRPEVVARVWNAIIQSRALVLDEMGSRHRAVSQMRDAEAEHLARRLSLARERLARLTVRGPDPHHPDRYRLLLDQASTEKETAERLLAQRSSVFRRELESRRVDFTDVARKLPEASALVSFAQYVEADGGLRSYVALVLRAGGGDPVIVSIGPAVEIDALVSRWREDATRPPSVHNVSVTEAERRYRLSGQTLREKIWDPLRSSVGDAELVFLVPDGALHLVSFSALPSGDGRFLVETGPLIHYLSAERDLVSLQSTSRPRGNDLLALGGPAFDEAATGAEENVNAFRGERSGCGYFQNTRFDPLPFTRREVDEITTLWRRTSPAEASKITGPEATEAYFKREAPGRRILHLATHGFFLGDRCPSAHQSSRAIKGLSPAPQVGYQEIGENPLLLSGLALAGANNHASASPDQDDGILTAEEIASLDLSSVEWAVLSACDTALGKLEVGEGVLGLRRAFEVSGVATTIMSLWSVQDEATREWMIALYSARLVEKLGSAEAMKRASLEVLERRRQAGESTHPFFWAAFVAAGQWS